MRSHYLQLIGHYRYLALTIILTLTGGVGAFSLLLLHVAPLYTATATVSLLPTDSELAFSQTFVRSTTFNPANLMTQTHVENLISREIARETVDKLTGEGGASLDQPPQPRWMAAAADWMRSFRQGFRRYYNILNFGKHVPVDPYADLVNGLQEAISIETLEGTYILRINVSWEDPEFAAAAANTLSETYLEHARSQAREASLAAEQALHQEMMKGQTNVADLQRQIDALRLARVDNISLLRVIDPAVPPIYPSFPKVVVNTVAAFVSSLVLTAIAIIAADTFSNTLKTTTDLNRVLGPAGLGRVRAKSPSAAVLTDIARQMNLQCLALPSMGGVMAMDNDADSRAGTEIIQTALTGLGNADEHVDNGVTDLGGAAGRFSMARIEPGQETRPVDWVVIALRQGRITEDVLKSTVAELRSHGARRVFGLFLTG